MPWHVLDPQVRALNVHIITFYHSAEDVITMLHVSLSIV